MNFGRIARPSATADLRRGENGRKVKNNAGSFTAFPSACQRAPPLRSVDGWATDATRRKIERSKKERATREDAVNDDLGKSEKNRPILAEAASILFLLSAIVSPPTTLSLFGICYRTSSMQPVIIITVLRLYARSDDSSDGAWLLFRSTSSFRAL